MNNLLKPPTTLKVGDLIIAGSKEATIREFIQDGMGWYAQLSDGRTFGIGACKLVVPAKPVVTSHDI